MLRVALCTSNRLEHRRQLSSFKVSAGQKLENKAKEAMALATRNFTPLPFSLGSCFVDFAILLVFSPLFSHVPLTAGWPKKPPGPRPLTHLHHHSRGSLLCEARRSEDTAPNAHQSTRSTWRAFVSGLAQILVPLCSHSEPTTLQLRRTLHSHKGS